MRVGTCGACCRRCASLKLRCAHVHGVARKGILGTPTPSAKSGFRAIGILAADGESVSPPPHLPWHCAHPLKLLCQYFGRRFCVCMGAGRKASYSSDSGLCFRRQPPPRARSHRPLRGHDSGARFWAGCCVRYLRAPQTVLGEVAAEPLHLANRSFSQLEWTPLYTGFASPLNVRLISIRQSRLPSPRLPLSRRPSVRLARAPLCQLCTAHMRRAACAAISTSRQRTPLSVPPHPIGRQRGSASERMRMRTPAPDVVPTCRSSTCRAVRRATAAASFVESFGSARPPPTAGLRAEPRRRRARGGLPRGRAPQAGIPETAHSKEDR